MCGICGLYNPAGISANDKAIVEAMNRTQKHRGPDDEGLWADDSCAVGHTRLAIIDLTKNGHQPFASDDGRYWLTYNGEIYNYIEIRQILKSKGVVFRTHTDTEVLLKAYLFYGPKCLDRFNGMFAFAVYDSKDKVLFLARDRVGVKPLYYRLVRNKLAFASEAKSLRWISNQGDRLTVNQRALFDFLCFNRTDIQDETFLVEIKRLPKGHYALFDAQGLRLHQWWNPESYLGNQAGTSEEEVLRRVREILVSAVQLRMRSDVPVGSCLSGGLDSSILVGILYTMLNAERGYRTFTAAFPGFRLDETGFVDALNERFPFANHRAFPTADAAFDNLERFVYMNDEPTTSPTFYSQYEVMRLAKERGVTVLLDGQGGDENFAGYQYFHGFFFAGLWRERKLPRLAREIWCCIRRKQDKSAFETFIYQTAPDRLRKTLLLKTLPYVNQDFFHAFIDSSVIHREFFSARDLNWSIVRHFQYKLEHLLRMEDRNSMAFQIEARLPYLDFRLVEFLLGVPAEMKIVNGENKFLQKRAAGNFSIPAIIGRRDKVGFGTPGEEWMRQPRWRRITRENYDYLLSSFPGMLVDTKKQRENRYDSWKINQLAVWHRQVTGSDPAI